MYISMCVHACLGDNKIKQIFKLIWSIWENNKLIIKIIVEELYARELLGDIDIDLKLFSFKTTFMISCFLVTKYKYKRKIKKYFLMGFQPLFVCSCVSDSAQIHFKML